MPWVDLGNGVSTLRFPCKRHSSPAGIRCNVRVAACAHRRALSIQCPRCAASAGSECVNLSKRQKPAFLHQQRLTDSPAQASLPLEGGK